MIPTLLTVAVVGAGLTVFGLVVVAVYAPRAYRNGYTAGQRDEQLRHHPSSGLRLLPAQRTTGRRA